MAINKPVKMEWDGKTYDIKITMDVIDRIDDQVNLAMMTAQCLAGDIRFTKVAKLFTVLLNEARAGKKDSKSGVIQDIEVDEVFHALFGSGEITQKEVQPMVNAIFTAIFPEPKKKSTTPSAKRKPRKRVAKKA